MPFIQGSYLFLTLPSYTTHPSPKCKTPTLFSHIKQGLHRSNTLPSPREIRGSLIVPGQLEQHVAVCSCHVIPEQMSRVSFACVHLPNLLFAATNIFALQSMSRFYEYCHPLQDQICSSLLWREGNSQEEISCTVENFCLLKH